MTKAEKHTKLEALQADAKDYQAEIGYLTLQKQAAEKRVADLTVLMAEGERKFAALQREQTTEPAEVPNA